MFKITGSAHSKLSTIMEGEKSTEDEVLYVRLTMGIGWGGPQLKLSLEERPLSEDELFEFESLKILIHKKDMVYFNHTKLDYLTDVFGNGRFQLLKI